MATLTIRNFDDALYDQLRLRAARHGRSIEEETCSILRCALMDEPVSGKFLVDSIRKGVEPHGGVDLDLPAREPMRDPPDFR